MIVALIISNVVLYTIIVITQFKHFKTIVGVLRNHKDRIIKIDIRSEEHEDKIKALDETDIDIKKKVNDKVEYLKDKIVDDDLTLKGAIQGEINDKHAACQEAIGELRTHRDALQHRLQKVETALFKKNDIKVKVKKSKKR